MPRISIKVKYSLLVLFSILATSGLLSWFVLGLIDTEVRAQLKRRGESVTQQLAWALAPVLLSKDDAKVRAALNRVFEDSDIVAGSIIDADGGRVVADGDEGRVGQSFFDPFVPVEERDCSGMVEDSARDRLIFMRTASFSGVRVGCVVIQISRDSLDKVLGRATAQVLFLTAVIALAVIVLSFLTLRRTLKPLGQIIEGTRRIAEGDFSTRLSLASKDEIGDLAEAFNSMAARTELLFRYVDKSVAERLIHDESLALPGGRLKQVSVLFGDMRGFTELSNERSPGEVVWILNTYFDLFFQVVHHFSGVVDKTMGDAIMAFFEPYRPKDTSNAERAAMSAVAMQAAVWTLGEILAEAGRLGIPTLVEPCRFGFAVATGRLIVGNIGSKRHMDYTVCGPAVNLAARLQQDTRRGEIIVDHFTAMDVDKMVVTRRLPRVRPNGFSPSQEVTPFQVVELEATELVRMRKLLRLLFTRRFLLEHIVAFVRDGTELPVDRRAGWAAVLHDHAAGVIERDPPSFLVN